jgi:acyl carrier protein phosphodiesterase
MNYLAHAYLTKSSNRKLLMGNLMGDFVKGNQFKNFEPDIQQGILLHRNIDTFTDANKIIRDSKNLFRPQCGLYSGIIVDTLMDHFVATDKRIFETDYDLQLFVEKIYSVCVANNELMNEKMHFFIQNMIQYNWLYNYKNKEGIHKSFIGMQKRMVNFPDAQIVIQLFEDNYSILKKYYMLLIDELEQEFLI